ncbi:MAG: pilus assembly protein TadG-related protein [Candidatus Elarobacter sp.]
MKRPMGSRGQVLPLVGLSATILLGAAALAIDVGYLRYQQRIQQSATDSAAIAGASELIYRGNAATAAKSDSSTNGFTDDGSNVIVTMNNPPASGPYGATANAVEVLIRKKNALFFAGVFGTSPQWVQTRAVARVTNNSNICIFALSGDITLRGGGGGGINAPTCGLITNGNLTVTGQANVNALTVGYVGSSPGGGSYPLGQPMRAVAASDPCSTYPGCAYLSSLKGEQLQTGCMPQSPLPDPIPPGEYCQPLSLSGTVNFSPGLFVLDQGMSAGGQATLSGTGVTLYNRGGLTLSGNVSVNITAPTSGNSAGVVYYQPPANTSRFTINGRAGTDNFAGAVYLPAGTMTLNGNVPNITFLVAASITMNGGGMSAGPSTMYLGLPHAVLAE